LRQFATLPRGESLVMVRARAGEFFGEAALAVDNYVCVEISLSKVKQLPEIMKYGVMSTPGVVVDGKVVHAGGIPDRAKVAGWLLFARPAARFENWPKFPVDRSNESLGERERRIYLIVRGKKPCTASRHSGHMPRCSAGNPACSRARAMIWISFSRA
jgi:hypothetical protein